jgi:hypothetical protein
MGDRWAALFADLEGELDAAEAAELDAEVRDRARREQAGVRLAERLHAAVGTELAVTTAAGTVRGTLDDAAPDWLLLSGTLVPASAVRAVSGLGPHAAVPGPVTSRLTFGYALRALARGRTPVTVTLTDGTTLTGTFDRVGADHADLAEHPPGELRRTAAVSGVRTIAFAGIATVR